MTDTELLDFCDAAFKRDFTKANGVCRDVIIGDVSVMVGGYLSPMTFREVIECAVQQRVDVITKRLTS